MRRGDQGKYLRFEMTFLVNLTIGGPARPRNFDGPKQRKGINMANRQFAGRTQPSDDWLVPAFTGFRSMFAAKLTSMSILVPDPETP